MTAKIILILISLMRPAPILTMEMEVTAYCSCEKCCGVHADGITASGYVLDPGEVRPHKVIAAPKHILFGTKIYVPGYGIASVEDRGGAIKDNRLDVYFSTHKEALIWGRQKLFVEMR